MNINILGMVLRIPAILIAFIVQGYARAKVADKLGDKMPKFQGRLTLNPAAHIDLIGFIMIIFTGFGWTKRVETNPRAYKRGYKDEIKVTIAGPLGNLLVGFLGMFILVLYSNLVKNYGVVWELLTWIYIININLFVFNLLPIPGLAGFELFRELSPKNFYKYGMKMYDYQMIILLVIVFLGQYILGIPRSFIIKIFSIIINLILGIFI